MGSEFTYEDLTPVEITKYDYRYLGDEKYQDHECFLVESHPRFKNSGYSKTISWIRKEDYQTIRQDFYDKRGKILKRAHFIGLKKINGKFWRADSIEMVNLQNQKKTTFRNLSRKLSNGFSESEFTKRAIQQWWDA